MSGGESPRERDRDRLAKDLANRLVPAVESNDLTAVLDPAVPRLTRDLGDMLMQDLRGAVTPAVQEIICLLVHVHWYRISGLPEEQCKEDSQGCLRWSAVLLPMAPELLPEPVVAFLTASDLPGGGGGSRTSMTRPPPSFLAGSDMPGGGTAAEANDRGAVLYELYRRNGTMEVLQTAVSLFRDAVDATPVGHPDRPMYLSNLGMALQTRYGDSTRQEDLDEAVAKCEDAVHATPADDPERSGRLSNLSIAVRTRYERTGQLADLDRAVRLSQEAVDIAKPGHPDLARWLGNLAHALQTRFERTGQLADLDQAIARLSEAVDAIPADYPARLDLLSNLGAALRARFGRTGQLADLDRAITTLSEAGAAAPADHTGRPGPVSNLGGALQSRFERTGQLADLDQAIILFSEAVDVTPAGHPARAGRLSSLGNSLQTRFERTKRHKDMQQALVRLSEAVSMTPLGDLNRPMYLDNLGNALRTWFGVTKGKSDLDRAVILLSEAVQATPAGHPDRPLYLSNLGAALRTRFASSGQLADLDQAITTLSEAVDAAPADHPDRTMYLFNLAQGLRTRFERTKRQEDVDRAVKVFREGAGTLTASPWMRVAAARGWGLCGMLAKTPESAVEGYAAAVELLPLAAWHGLDQATREHHLRESAGLASDAAAATVAAGDPVRAVELLEAGRSMLWTQALHLRQDLAELEARAPELAAALESSRAVLNGSVTSAVHDPDAAGGIDQRRAAEQGMLEERRRAARDWDAALDRIRRVEGFEHFLRPVAFADLRAAAAGGPVVIVNISRHGSHALILTPEPGPRSDPAVRAVGLLAAPMDTVVEQALTLLRAVRKGSDPAADLQTRNAARHAVLDVLDWSWQAITEPVLTALGRTDTPPGRIEDWPRVWWCPTGAAAVLPLHAAGRRPGATDDRGATVEAAAPADNVAGRVISSYTPTLTSLIRARSQPAPGRVRQLAVGVPEAVSYLSGAGPLPGVPAEFQAVAEYLPAPHLATRLLGPAATKRAVLEKLPGHSWLHLSCHGFQHPADASLSAFLLHDQPLTLADLAALNLRDTDLAYLGACQTAVGDLRLLDEALHLAGALRLAGYRHVLATLWNISDDDALAMADITYAHLTHPDADHPDPADRPQADRAAFALYHAVTRLRQACPGEPLRWAPYVHLGP